MTAQATRTAPYRRRPGNGRGSAVVLRGARVPVLADRLPADLARLDHLQRARAAALPRRHGRGPGLAGQQARWWHPRRQLSGLHRARAAGRDRHADRVRRGPVPGPGLGQVGAELLRRGGQPAAARRRVPRPPAVRHPPADHELRDLPGRDRRVRRGPFAAGRFRPAGRRPDRAGVRSGADGLGGDPHPRYELQRAHAVPDDPAVPLLRHVLPDHPAARRGCGRSPT